MAGAKRSITKTNQRDDSLALAIPSTEQPQPLAVVAPIVSSYNEKNYVQFFDAVENLRRLNIAKEGIQLPTIVVVGDQSSGKSSVLESLAAISLPRGQDICQPGDLQGQERDFQQPIDIVVKKNGVPDISMVDLPGITRVLFMANLRISMTRDLGCGHKRLTSLLKLVREGYADDVNIGLGYVCVRNRIGSSYDYIKNLPEIVKKINEKLGNNLSELEKLPANLSSVPDALAAFMHIVGLSRDSLRKILLIGEFDEYHDDKQTHCTARLVEMLNSFASDLYSCAESDVTEGFSNGRRRLIDSIALHLMLSINDLVNKDLEKEICHDLLSPSGGGVERLLEESPSISGKREKLSRSVKVLRESKETVANIMDRIGSYGDSY
ncbi:P-loop containing nucleoside triphosphate hydrolase [Sesbania bispinosa]|nr:P-loop containing nucleoside triphosphate hydrolase [Sesbania bispinosa]